MPIAAIILAAGASTRLGTPKQLALLGGEPLLERALRTARAAQLSPVVIVLGANAAAIEKACTLQGGQVVFNPDWQEGMASSIRVGIGVLGDADGVILMTCDQPTVTAAHLRQLSQGGQGAVASLYGGRAGVPAYFPHTHFSELLLLNGDAGARSLLTSARCIHLEGGEIDVDTPQALEHARAQFGETGRGQGNKALGV